MTSVSEFITQFIPYFLNLVRKYVTVRITSTFDLFAPVQCFPSFFLTTWRIYTMVTKHRPLASSVDSSRYESTQEESKFDK